MFNNLIIKLRNQLIHRTITGFQAFLYGFSGIFLVILCRIIFVFVRKWQPDKKTVCVLVFTALVLTIFVGIIPQIRLFNKRAFRHFLCVMPIRPLDIIKLQIYVSLQPTAFLTICLACLIMASEVAIWTPLFLLKLFILAVVVIWSIILQVIFTAIISRYSKGWIILFLGGFCWLLSIFIHATLTWRVGNHASANFLCEIIMNDRFLWLIGVKGIINSLTNTDSLIKSNLVIIGHLSLVIVISSNCMYILSKNQLLNIKNKATTMFLANMFKTILSRLIPGEIGVNTSIECLRILRSSNEIIIFYVLTILLLSISSHMFYGDLDTEMLVIILGAMALSADTGVFILEGQRNKILYKNLGINPLYYLLSFIVSGAVVFSSFCVMMALILRFNCQSILIVFITCMSSCLILINYAIRTTKMCRISSSPLMNLRLGLACLVVSYLMLTLSLVNLLIPLAIAGLHLVCLFRDTNEQYIVNTYWED